MTPAELAVTINEKSPNVLRAMGIADRSNVLMDMGMFADEVKIGHPERPAEEWTPEELQAVIKLFKTWPQGADFKIKLKAFTERTIALYAQALDDAPVLDKKTKLQIAVKCFTQSAREVLGFDDFPEIELEFAPANGFYAGVLPDGKIQVCTRGMLKETIPVSEFKGDLSFLDLIFHEATHKLQTYMASKGTWEMANEYGNMHVAGNFYEATAELKKYNYDCYLEHPFESQARALAKDLCVEIQRKLPQQVLSV